MREMPDPAGAELFARARAGDQAAWGELFQNCQQKLRRVVRRKLDRPMRSLYDSSDFASDVWRSLWEQLDRFEFQSLEALESFLLRKAESKVIDEYRRQNALKRERGRTTRLEGDGPDDPGVGALVVSKEPTASKVLDGQERWERLLDQGDDDQLRIALEMARDQYSTVEIAERLGWSLRKVQREFQKLNPRAAGPSRRYA